MLNSYALMSIQAETLYTYQPNGRLQAINEPTQPPSPTPRFFFGQTKDKHLWRFRYDLSDAIVNRLTTVAQAEPPLREGQQQPENLELMQAILQTHHRLDSIWCGPAYYFPHEAQSSAKVIAVTTDNARLLQAHFSAWLEELSWRQPCVAYVEQGCAVAICCSARISAQAAEAGVETHPAFRGRGYAVQVVLGWAALVRAQGRIPLYSTSWENEASQRVAEKLGLKQYGVDFSLT